MKKAVLTLNYNGYEYSVDSNQLPRGCIGIFIRAAVKELEKMIESEGTGKKYNCAFPEECDQYKKQGNRATTQCDGCGSLRVAVK